MARGGQCRPVLAVVLVLLVLPLAAGPSRAQATVDGAQRALGSCLAILQGLAILSADRTIRPDLSPEGARALLSAELFRRVMARQYGPVGRSPRWTDVNPGLDRLPRTAEQQRATYFRRSVAPPILGLLEIADLEARKAQLNRTARAFLQVYCLCGVHYERDPSMLSLAAIPASAMGAARQQAQPLCGTWRFLGR